MFNLMYLNINIYILSMTQEKKLWLGSTNKMQEKRRKTTAAIL